MHDFRRVEPRERRVASRAVGERHRVDGHVARAGSRDGLRGISRRLRAVAQDDHAAAAGRCGHRRGDAGLEIRRARSADPGLGGGRKGLGAGRERDDPARLDARAPAGRVDPARLAGPHGRVHARRAVDREHDASRVRADVGVGQRRQARENREAGGHPRHADAPEVPHRRNLRHTSHSAPTAASPSAISHGVSELGARGDAARAQDATSIAPAAGAGAARPAVSARV